MGLSCHQSRGNSSTACEHRGCPRGVCSSPSRCCFCSSRWALYEKSGDRQKRYRNQDCQCTSRLENEWKTCIIKGETSYYAREATSLLGRIRAIFNGHLRV